ncbi:MAG TPA: nuclear transport factor 2 family protein [Sphingomonadales bacterium]
MIRGVHHVALSTANLDRLVAFYRDVLGFELATEEISWPKGSTMIDEIVGLKDSAARQVMLRAGNAYIEIFEYSSPAARDAEPLRACDRGYTHICFDVTNIDEVFERMKKAGVTFHCPPPEFDGLRATYGRDPDGNIIEIQEVLDENCGFHPRHLRSLQRDDLRGALRQLQDRQEITDLIHRYCRALDRCDEELLRSVFHPDSTHEHGPYKGTSAEFCGFAMDLLRSIGPTQHHLGNVLIDLQGDVAYAESYFVAYHRIPANMPSAQGIMADHTPGVEEDLFIGGRYVDRFERRGGQWKIAHRTGIHDWQRWETADERGFRSPASGLIGRRDRSDPVYLRP